MSEHCIQIIYDRVVRARTTHILAWRYAGFMLFESSCDNKWTSLIAFGWNNSSRTRSFWILAWCHRAEQLLISRCSVIAPQFLAILPHCASAMHGGAEQQRIGAQVQGNSLICSLARSYRWLVRLHAYFAYYLTRGKVNYWCPKMIWFLPQSAMLASLNVRKCFDTTTA